MRRLFVLRSARADIHQSVAVGILVAVGLAGCAASQERQQTAPTISIMTFNVENLFDTEDDPEKNDQTYLPLSAKGDPAHIEGCNTIEVERWREQCLHWDWNEEALEHKLTVVAAAVLQVNGGRGPDILALQEVENLAVLERLRTEYLGAADYRPAILVEGNDDRGIDVAFLSRLPLQGKTILHTIPFSGVPEERVADTRGILEATFRLPTGDPLTGFAVHFPAPFHPVEMRRQAYGFLNELQSRLPAERLAFAAGDFNTPANEDRREGILAELVEPTWDMAHRYCEGCPGTQYFAPDDSWSFLDTILWSRADRGAQTTWVIESGSVRIANQTPNQVTDKGLPARFDIEELTGVSDHWPLVMRVTQAIKQ